MTTGWNSDINHKSSRSKDQSGSNRSEFPHSDSYSWWHLAEPEGLQVQGRRSEDLRLGLSGSEWHYSRVEFVWCWKPVEQLQGPEVQTCRAAVLSPSELTCLATLRERVGPGRTTPGANWRTHQIRSNTDWRRSTSTGTGIGRATV